MSNSSTESENLAGIQGLCRPSPVDIVDLLPSDPFEMDRESDSEEITASVEGLEAELLPQLMDSRKGEFEGNRGGGGGDGLLPGLNLLCRGRVRLIPEMGNIESDGKPNGFSIDGYRVDESQGCSESFIGGEGKSNLEEHVSYGHALRGDVADMLPSDPFGMDVSTAFWGITGSFEGLEDIDWSFESGDYVNGRGDDGLVFGLNLVCRGRVRFMPEAGNDESDSKLNTISFDRVIVANDVDEFLNFGSEADSNAGSAIGDVQGCSEIADEQGDEPHYAMFLALRYLGVKDLLSVETVCRSLNSAVRSDPSLWMNINVDHPLNNMLNDDSLIKLTSRACGLLKSLTLVGCFRITNAGIKHVVDSNPGLTKLSVPGCFRLSIESMLTTFKSAGALALKQLRIGGLAGVTSEQYEELKVLLRVDEQLQSRPHKPVYYHDGHSCISVDDDRPIDIEKCPRCNEVRLVYDCPAESCQKAEAANSCKACFLCVNRCINCGCCLTNRDYVETFVLDAICLDCWDKIFNCQEAGRQEGISIFNQPIFCQATSYFCFYG